MGTFRMTAMTSARLLEQHGVLCLQVGEELLQLGSVHLKAKGHSTS